MYYCAQDLLNIFCLPRVVVCRIGTSWLRAAAANGYRDVVMNHDWCYYDTTMAIRGDEFLKNEQSQPFEILLQRIART